MTRVPQHARTDYPDPNEYYRRYSRDEHVACPAKRPQGCGRKGVAVNLFGMKKCVRRGFAYSLFETKKHVREEFADS